SGTAAPVASTTLPCKIPVAVWAAAEMESQTTASSTVKNRGIANPLSGLDHPLGVKYTPAGPSKTRSRARRKQLSLCCSPRPASGKAPVQTSITFLGTAAANAFPEAFCSCRNCTQARSAGGKSLRKRSAALINDDLLIDLGPDIMSASQIHGRSLQQV